MTGTGWAEQIITSEWNKERNSEPIRRVFPKLNAFYCRLGDDAIYSIYFRIGRMPKVPFKTKCTIMKNAVLRKRLADWTRANENSIQNDRNGICKLCEICRIFLLGSRDSKESISISFLEHKTLLWLREMEFVSQITEWCCSWQ